MKKKQQQQQHQQKNFFSDGVLFCYQSVGVLPDAHISIV